MTLGIGGNTGICGVIGDPISHTLSPAMFNAAFAERKLDYAYLPFRVESKYLDKAMDGFRALNITGLNITIPHKIAVMKMLDEIDEEARFIGAVNTVINEGGRLKGFNTDAEGFLYALARAKVAVPGKKVVVLGAGGASRAVVSAIAGHDGQIIILNRTLDKAIELARITAQRPVAEIKVLELTHENLAGSLKDADILVNTTSIGMSPDPGISPVPAELLKPSILVVDIVYNPLKTRLLAEAEKTGCRIVEGIHMLVGQAALSFEKWTGQKAPVELMTSVALAGLEKK